MFHLLLSLHIVSIFINLAKCTFVLLQVLMGFEFLGAGKCSRVLALALELRETVAIDDAFAILAYTHALAKFPFKFSGSGLSARFCFF